MSNGKQFYISTPIYYPSDYLHIGHCYTTVAADVVARYKRLQGYDVFFMTGTDEHGEKIAEKAASKGVSPKAYVDDIVAWSKKLWKRLHISYDHFIRTTDDYHESAVQKIFQKLYDQGDIYKGEYEGWYCVSCESYFTSGQVIEEEGETLCPDCRKVLTKRKEEAYFLRLSKYADWLINELRTTNFLEPQERVNEMINNFLLPGLEDLAVSRASVTWGVPVPFDSSHTIYVWIDALSNYITGLGYLSEDETNFKKYWPADVHLIGKEIVRFHSIIWPILLKMLGVPLPKKVFGHGWLLLDGGKMSKSVGNVVDPLTLADRYGVDAIRYYLTREIPFGSDGHYTQQAFLKRINSDLSNDLGNLWSRLGTMVGKYFDGKMPRIDEATYTDEDAALKNESLALEKKVEEDLNRMKFSDALQDIFDIIRHVNKYIEQRAPWQIAKDPAREQELKNVIGNALEAFRITATLLQPVLVDTTRRIFPRMGKPEEVPWQEARTWQLLSEGTPIEKGDALFPRFDIEKELAVDAPDEGVKKKEKKDTKGVPEGIATISFDEFKNVEILVAEVLEAERVKGTDKLLHISLDIGREKRSVVAGVYPHYTPEDMKGRKVVFLANLQPRKIKGLQSQGMLLAAVDNETFSLLSFDRAGVTVGTRIS